MTERDPDLPNAPTEPEAARSYPALQSNGAPAPAESETPRAESVDAPAEDPVVTVRMRVRRAPNFGAFIVTGAVAGMILGFLFNWFWPAISGIQGPSPYAPASEAAFFATIIGLFGALVGALVAIWLDKRS